MYFPSSVGPIGAGGASMFGGVNPMSAMQQGMQTAYINPMLRQALAQKQIQTAQMGNSLAFQNPLLMQQLRQQMAQTGILGAQAEYAPSQQQGIAAQQQGLGQQQMGLGKYTPAQQAALAENMHQQALQQAYATKVQPKVVSSQITGTAGPVAAAILRDRLLMGANPGFANTAIGGAEYALNPMSQGMPSTPFLQGYGSWINPTGKVTPAQVNSDGSYTTSTGEILVRDPNSLSGWSLK